MDYYRKKFKNKTSPDAVSVLTEKEYKYASLQAISNQTIRENDEKILKELLEEVNSHLTDLRSLAEDKEVCDSKAVREKCAKLTKQFEDCLVKLLNKDESEKVSEKDGQLLKNETIGNVEADQALAQIGPNVGRIEIEEKLKQMRQKRLNRLSTFVNEQAKLSEQRSEQHQALAEEKREAETPIIKTNQEKQNIEQSSSEPNMFHRSGSSRVTDLRSSFGRGGGAKIADLEGSKKNVPKLPSKLQTKPSSSIKSLESPKTPTQKRNFFNSISCLTEEKKADTDKIIEENDKMMNEIKQVQLKKTNISNPKISLETPQNSAEIRKTISPNFNHWKMNLNRLSDNSNSKDDVSKITPKKSIAVLPPKVDFPPKTQQPFSSRSKSDLHENWKSTKVASITKNNSFKSNSKTVSNTDLDSIIESVKRNSKGSECIDRASNERCSFSTFRTSKDSLNLEKNEIGKTKEVKRKSLGPVYASLNFNNSQPTAVTPKREKTNYETVDFTKTLELNKNTVKNVTNLEVKASKDDSNISLVLKELLNSCKTLDAALKTKNAKELVSTSNDLLEMNRLINNLKIKIEESGSVTNISPLFSPYREELSKLEKQVQSFKGLRRDLEYLILSSHISKIYIDVKNIDCPSKEHEKRRHSFLEKVNDLEKNLEKRMDKNEEILFGILEEQARLIGEKEGVPKMLVV